MTGRRYDPAAASTPATAGRPAPARPAPLPSPGESTIVDDLRRIRLELAILEARAKLAGSTYQDGALIAAGADLELIGYGLDAVARRLPRRARGGG